ncbi:MAG: aspartate kinase [Halobacteria archaeon]|nr:aspartate kinase [Halobacteria archaeon]
MSTIVVKFGGTSVGSGERIKHAAENIAKEVEDGKNVCVVVSAMGNTTDDLIEEMEKVGATQDEEVANEIVSMGERTSVRLFTAALNALDIDSEFVEPGDELWPIITDEKGYLEDGLTTERMNRLAEELDDCVPVVCGFLGETPEGTITTLGRGGSDTTAMILGDYFGAEEVIIVTDVEGIMTGDPRSVENAKSVESITVDEMQDLSIRGAGVIASSALRYKNSDMNVRIIHHKQDDLMENGTVIEGEGDHTHVVEAREDPLAAVTVAGRSVIETPNLLSRLSTKLGENDINIYGHSTGKDSMSFFVDQDVGREAERILHDEIVNDEKFSSVSIREDIAMIMVSGGDFIDTPGMIYKIVEPMYENDINIIEIISSVTSVVIFVDYNVGDETFELIEDVFDESRTGAR